MKAAATAKRPRAGAKATTARKPARRKAKKTFDLSWLLDRPLPPQDQLPENPVLVARRMS